MEDELHIEIAMEHKELCFDEDLSKIFVTLISFHHKFIQKVVDALSSENQLCHLL